MEDTRLIFGPSWYSRKNMLSKVVDSKAGQRYLYVPDNHDEIFFDLTICSCSSLVLRVVLCYPQFTDVGRATPDYGLHFIGDRITPHLPLNVLLCRNLIKGNL